jgi:tetratricopeptide (TPR) repeat protein
MEMAVVTVLLLCSLSQFILETVGDGRCDARRAPLGRMQRMRNSSRVVPLFAIVLFLLAVIPTLYGEENSGSIRGTVRDQTGIVLAGAKITLTNVETSLSISTVTSNEGRYSFAATRVGVYTLEAERSGFHVLRREVKVSPHHPVTMDFELAKADVAISGSPAAPPSKKDLNEAASELGAVTFHDTPKFKLGALDNSQFGGHTSAGEAEASRRLLQGVAELKTNPPAVKPTSEVKSSVSHNTADQSGIEFKLKQALRLDPNNFELNHNLGEFYIQQEKLAAAIPYLEKAQRIDPSHYVNGYDLALAYLQTQSLAQARRHIQGMLRTKDTAELHNLLGEVEEAAGNSLVAANEYQRAAHMEPNEKHMFDWGNQLLLHSAYEPATQVFTHGVRRHPSSARLRIGLGIALYSRGQYDEAVKSLCLAVDMDPSDPRPYFFLGKTYDVSIPMAEEVTKRLAHFVRLYPKNALAHYYYALSLWKGQRGQDSQGVDQVEELFKSALVLDPGIAEAHLQLGILYAHQQKDADAIREYEMAIKLQPDLADAHYRLGQAYQRSGDGVRAKEHLEIYRQLRTDKPQGQPKRDEQRPIVLTTTEAP